MSTTYQPQAGYVARIIFNGVTLNLFEYDYEDDMDVQNAPAFNQVSAARGPLSTVGYMSHTPGLITGWCSGTGVFDQLTQSVNGIKVGFVGAMSLYINNTVVSTSAAAICKRWHVKASAPGQTIVSGFWIYDEQFTDFANTNA